MLGSMMFDGVDDVDEAEGHAQRLARLVAGRLCHDLSGLLGTLMGALEMSLDETPRPGEALLLADDAARELGVRLRLLRAAWAGDGTVLDGEGLAALMPGLPAGRRVRVDATGLRGGFPGPVGRTLLNLVLLGAEALPGGGLIALSGTWPGQLAVRASGPRLTRPASLTGHLAGLDPAPAGPRDVQVSLAFSAAAAAGVRLSAAEDDGGDALAFVVSAGPSTVR